MTDDERAAYDRIVAMLCSRIEELISENAKLRRGVSPGYLRNSSVSDPVSGSKRGDV